MIGRWFHIIVLMVCSIPFAQAQFDTLALSFRHLTIKDGLSQGMVNHIIQDRYGFMWFSTKDGLNRYDGYHFEVYRHDLADTTTISDSYVSYAFEDSRGHLWVGTQSGLDRFDRERGTFIRFPNDGGDSSSLRSGLLHGRSITSISEDKAGHLWVSTTVGVDRIVLPSDMDPRPDNVRIDHFVVSGNVWRLNVDRHGILHGFELRHSSVQIVANGDGYRIDTTRIHSGMPAPVDLMLAEDTIHDRTYLVNGHCVVEYDHGAGRVEMLFDLPTLDIVMSTPQPAVDAKGRIWLAGLGSFWRFDPNTRRMSRITAKDPNLAEYAHGAKATYEDRNGLIWIGTSGYGILTYDPRSERFDPHIGRSVSGLTPTPDGKVIVDERLFLSVFDPVTDRFVLRLTSDDVKQRTGFDGVLYEGVNAVQDRSGVFWTSKQQLDRYDHERRQLRRIQREDSEGATQPFSSFCFPFHLDDAGLLWFGSGDEFHSINVRTNEQTHYKYPIPAADYQYLFLQAIHKGADGIFWLGTTGGLLRFDPSKDEWRHIANDPNDLNSLSYDVIFSLLDDPKEPERFLWVGTNGGGLNRVEKATGRAVRFTKHQGLPNDVVYGILADDQGDLWMSTNKGLARFDPVARTFRNYDESDGLQGDEFNRYAYCRMPDGTLYFGGINGFNRFKPEELKDDARPMQVLITDIKLMNRSIVPGADGSLLAAPSYLSEGMEIPHGNNMITFEFAGMEFAVPGTHQYQYKLEGFDPDWIFSGNANTAIYTNLDPGRYTFRVRGRNRDGVWDERGSSFDLAVRPPWWMHWAFYAVMVLLLVAGIWLYVRGVRMQKVKLEQTVQLRTRELLEAKERAEQSERIKQQFLANMSHEIRTPMNAVMGMTNILRRRDHPPEQDRYLDAIAVSSKNLLVVINDILDLSKMEAGKIVLDKAPFEPRKLIDDLREILHFNAEEKGIDFELNVHPDVPERLLGDQTRLQQVLLNLLGNALKFTEKGSVHLMMSVQGSTATRCVVRIEVSDTGVGIPADRLPRIFDEFTQAYSDTSRKFGGTGLGLSISKRLVDMQDGTIAVESEQGKGSRFMVSLPFEIPEPDGLPATMLSTAPGLQDLRILLAEDNEFNAIVAHDELQEAIPGLQLTMVRNGREAFAIAASMTFDIVLMDVQMPEMNGYEATKAIRELKGQKGKVPIIAMTANVLASELELCEQAGMNGHIPKPFSRDQLVGAIADALA